LITLTGCGGLDSTNDTKVSSEDKVPYSEEGLLYRWTSLPIKVSFSSRMDKDFIPPILAAMSSWENAVGMKLFAIDKETDVDPLIDLPAIRTDSMNGVFLLKDWRTSGRVDTAIAFTSSMSEVFESESQRYNKLIEGDLFFNTDLYFFGDSMVRRGSIDKTRTADIQTTALHELGHFLLGPSHVSEDVDDTSIMNPTVMIGQGHARRRLSSLDIERVHASYGCQERSCDVGWVMGNDDNINAEGFAKNNLTGDITKSADDDSVKVPFD
jgi:hypothetical protein